MKLKSKLFCSLFLASLIPLLVIGLVSYQKSKTALTQDKTEALEEIARISVSRIERFFKERKADIRTAQNFYNIKVNLPIVSSLANDNTDPEYLAAKEMLDTQLKTLQKVYDYDDVMLVNTKGKIVYVTNAAHKEADLGYLMPDPGNRAFEGGKQGIYVSEPYLSGRRENHPHFLVTAPIHGFSGEWIGVIAFEIDMRSVTSG